MDDTAGSIETIFSQFVSSDLGAHAPLFISALLSLFIPSGLLLLGFLMSSRGSPASGGVFSTTERRSASMAEGFSRLGPKLNTRVFVSLSLVVLMFCFVCLMIPLAASIGQKDAAAEQLVAPVFLFCLMGALALTMMLYVGGKRDNKLIATHFDSTDEPAQTPEESHHDS